MRSSGTPGRRAGSTVPPGPDAPAGTSAPARVCRDGTLHDVLVSWLDPSRQTGHRGPGFRAWRHIPQRPNSHDHDDCATARPHHHGRDHGNAAIGWAGRSDTVSLWIGLLSLPAAVMGAGRAVVRAG